MHYPTPHFERKRQLQMPTVKGVGAGAGAGDNVSHGVALANTKGRRLWMISTKFSRG
jgi:hypothetical protein